MRRNSVSILTCQLEFQPLIHFSDLFLQVNSMRKRNCSYARDFYQLFSSLRRIGMVYSGRPYQKKIVVQLWLTMLYHGSPWSETW